MDEIDAREADAIVQRLLTHLNATVPANGGDASAKARAHIGVTMASSLTLLRNDHMGLQLDQCFLLARRAGASLGQLEQVRVQTWAEPVKTLGATLIRDNAVYLCLTHECIIIANMTFVSRQDVDTVKARLVVPFNDAQEEAADSMDSDMFEALITLQSAIVNFLVSTARPLPRMLNYQFADTYATLVLAYRLYADASRGDEVRAENKIVHPLFAPRTGQALSA